jgi:protease I
MSHILFIIPPERFRDEELFVTQACLEKSGHTTTVASMVKGDICGSRGGKVKSKLTLDEVETKDFGAVVFVGGGGSKLLFNNTQAHHIARKMYTEGKVIAAICLAPVIVANAGLLNGIKATVAGTEARTLEEKGAIYAGPGVFTDKNIVTANGPKSSAAFADAIHTLLAV